MSAASRRASRTVPLGAADRIVLSPPSRTGKQNGAAGGVEQHRRVTRERGGQTGLSSLRVDRITGPEEDQTAHLPASRAPHLRTLFSRSRTGCGGLVDGSTIMYSLRITQY